jgi:integrase
MKFTTAAIASLQLPAGKREHIVWDPDLPGFGVRIRGSGKAWRIQYRVGRQQRSESLGDVRKVGLEAARKIARQRFAQVELGKDPGAERDKARQADTARELTLGRVVAKYLAAKEGSLAPSTYRSARRYLTDYWRPLHKLPIDQVKRSQVALLLHDFTAAHGAMAARGAKKNLSAFYGWAAREGLLDDDDTNPTLNTNNPGAGRLPRDRVLSDDEIRIIWRVAGEADDDFGRVVRLCLLTLCRREEIGGLRWDELNLETGQMVLPAGRTKNRRPHELVLPESALEILRAQYVQCIPGRPWVFGRAGAGLTGWSYHKNRFERLVVEAAGRPLPQWQIHDLRRTAATRIGAFVPPHVVEALLNHAKPTLVGTYNLASYQAEKAQALARWSEELLALVEGCESNALSMSQRA